ncbi:hypothetical protein VNO80_07863 [Phaseolus coccineus]|uniref:Uncharacterized protein n=1 Tax=Phaseolus coccineus TaxID=3886 RepID=A0AAN9RQ36_PHACN
MRRPPPLGRDGEELTCAAGERGPPLTLAMTNSLALIIKISCLWGGHLVGVIKVTHRQRSFPFPPFLSFDSQTRRTKAPAFLPSLFHFFLLILNPPLQDICLHSITCCLFHNFHLHFQFFLT